MTGAFNWFVFTFFRRSWSQLSSHRHCEPKCSVYKRKLVLPKDGAWTSCQFWVTWWSMGKLLVGPCLPSLSLWLNDYHVCIRSAWDAEDILLLDWFGWISCCTLYARMIPTGPVLDFGAEFESYHTLANYSRPETPSISTQKHICLFEPRSEICWKKACFALWNKSSKIAGVLFPSRG